MTMHCLESQKDVAQAVWALESQPLLPLSCAGLERQGAAAMAQVQQTHLGNLQLVVQVAKEYTEQLGAGSRSWSCWRALKALPRPVLLPGRPHRLLSEDPEVRIKPLPVACVPGFPGRPVDDTAHLLPWPHQPLQPRLSHCSVLIRLQCPCLHALHQVCDEQPIKTAPRSS